MSDTQNAFVVEVVLIKPAAHITRQAMIDTLSAMQVAVEKKDGYIKRQVLEENGQWIDLVWWESLASAKQAAQEIESDPDLAPHFAIFADAEMTMMHLNPVMLENATS